MAGILKVIGLTSGTSLDGIAAALVGADDEGVAIPGPTLTQPWTNYAPA
jgi:1,6-anhydro-N-acetylmuramate kinase